MDERSPPQDDEAGLPRPEHGYASLQLARAWTAWEDHHGKDARAIASVKITQWNKVIDGIFDGSISVGSRAPLAATPVWATLEVVTGGFATGGLKAGGPLQGHELALLEKLNINPGDEARGQLNAYFLSEEGIATLQSQLQSGCYDICSAEEGALLVAAWLLKHGKVDAARELIGHIAPWFGQLRFFPVPTSQPRQLGARVSLADVQDVMEILSSIAPKRSLMRQARTINVRLPLYDRMVSLFLETVEGEPPRIEPDANGAWTDSVSRKFLTVGGWPCRHYPPGWMIRARALLDEIDQAHAESEDDSYAQMCKHLRACQAAPQALTGRDVGRIRLLLARYISKRGEPGSASCAALRQSQAAQANTLDHHLVAGIVKARLAHFPGHEGLDDFLPVIGPLTPDEAQQWQVRSGTFVPRGIRRKVGRAHIDTVQAHVRNGRISSAEMLATVLPLMSSSITAAGIAERSLAQLYGAVYQAFRRRRSLLLLNLQKQVQLEELPWVAPMDAMRVKGGEAAAIARKALEDIVLLTLTCFPQTAIPNKLLQELRALAKTANLKLPLVEELAVDIFEGDFSEKFVEAARRAAAMLGNTIYATYYAIDTHHSLLRQPAQGVIDTIVRVMRPAAPDKGFLSLCEARAGVKSGGYSTVVNGMLIEQQQILTTQNLAVLVDGLALQAEIETAAPSLARTCFAWISRELQLERGDRHARLIARKNSAYAWRQMIFFLALAPAAATAEFLVWASDYLGKQKPAFAARFAPALAGLALAAEGKSFGGAEAAAAGARRFLAYSQGPHWL